MMQIDWTAIALPAILRYVGENKAMPAGESAGMRKVGRDHRHDALGADDVEHVPQGLLRVLIDATRSWQEQGVDLPRPRLQVDIDEAAAVSELQSNAPCPRIPETDSAAPFAGHGRIDFRMIGDAL